MARTEPSFRRQRPSGLLRFFLKQPQRLYHGPVAEFMRRRYVMLLTTTGRKSGLPRTNGVSFMPLDGSFIIFSGWGVNSNWYRNLRANPEVVIQVGQKRLRATARPIEDPVRRRELMLMMRRQSAHAGPPKFMRPMLRLTRLFDYDREIRMAVEHAEELPVIELVPHGEA